MKEKEIHPRWTEGKLAGTHLEVLQQKKVLRAFSLSPSFPPSVSPSLFLSPLDGHAERVEDW